MLQLREQLSSGGSAPIRAGKNSAVPALRQYTLIAGSRPVSGLAAGVIARVGCCASVCVTKLTRNCSYSLPLTVAGAASEFHRLPSFTFGSNIHLRMLSGRHLLRVELVEQSKMRFHVRQLMLTVQSWLGLQLANADWVLNDFSHFYPVFCCYFKRFCRCLCN